MANVAEFLPNVSLTLAEPGNYILNIVVSLPVGYAITAVNWDADAYTGAPIHTILNSDVRTVIVTVANNGASGGLIEEQGTLIGGTDQAVAVEVKEGENCRGCSAILYINANI